VWEARQAYQQHLVQLVYTDRVLGAAMTRLRALHQFDRSVIVVTADHGIDFTDSHTMRDPTAANLGNEALVPLMVKRPHQRTGRVSRSPARTIDAVPLLAQAAGIRVTYPHDGRIPSGSPSGRVRMMRTTGWKPVELPLGELVRETRRTVEWKSTLFPQPGVDGLFRAGPDRELIGRPVAALRVRSRGPLSAHLRPPAGPPFVPALVEGTVHGAQPGQRLLVAVNGVIQASTVTIAGDPDPSFEALLPESVLRGGLRKVELIAAGPGRSLTLVALES
jgi:hypothetical protein